MVVMKCDFCDNEVTFDNMKDILNANLTIDTNYYVVCVKCAEKINNLVDGSFQVIQINAGEEG